MTIMKFNFVLMQVIFGREQLFKNAGVILLHEQGIVLQIKPAGTSGMGVRDRGRLL